MTQKSLDVCLYGWRIPKEAYESVNGWLLKEVILSYHYDAVRRYFDVWAHQWGVRVAKNILSILLKEAFNNDIDEIHYFASVFAGSYLYNQI